MKIVIDRNLCTGHGRCYMLASDLFSADDEGNSVVKHEGVPPELEGQARTAERNCPERAIRLV